MTPKVNKQYYSKKNKKVYTLFKIDHHFYLWWTSSNWNSGDIVFVRTLEDFIENWIPLDDLIQAYDTQI